MFKGSIARTVVAGCSLAAAGLVVMAPSARAQQAGGGAAAPAADIVGVASGNASFTTLVAAVKAAGLVETLQGPGPFTVFAPTDAAFAKIPKATLDALLADREALTKVLLLHVVPGRVMAADIVRTRGARPKTANGQALSVTVKGGKVYANGAQVVMADVPASNGVIHAIDTVILPADRN